MDLRTKIKGLKALGLANVWRALAYSRRRDKIERRFAPAGGGGGEAREPGAMLEVTDFERGARFRFRGAELEVCFLTDALVRVTWTPGELPLPYALVEREWPQVEVRAREADGGGRVLETGALRVVIGAEGSVALSDAAGGLVRSEEPPRFDDPGWTHRAALADDEAIFGLGERTAPLNLRGGRYRLYNREPNGAYTEGDDPLYVTVPVYLGLRDEGAAHLVFYESPWDAELDLGGAEAAASFAGGALRYYWTTGDLPSIYRRYGELTGTAPLPPRWALGYHQARWSYLSGAEVRELRARFRELDLPLSAIHLDIHYMDGYRVFTVDTERFPDLCALSSELASGAEPVRLVAILDPGVKVDPQSPLYTDGLKRDAYCKLPDGEVVEGPVWPGWCAFPDFTDPAVREWWADHYGFFDAAGIAGVWHDMNEPAAFAAWSLSTLPSPTRHRMEGRGGSHVEAHNLYALLEARAGHDGLLRHRPGHRPWILSRSGWAGLQRYAWTWSGDCEATWWTVRQSLRIAVGMGLSGIPYSGPDIGGFGGLPSPELYIRWFQLAAFLPFFRTHSAAFVPRREPWSFGEPALGIARDFLKLRYRLMPYLYTLAREVSREGCPFVRPMFWADPGDRALREADDQLLVGDALLVAPIVAESARSRRVVLPVGRWYDLWDDTPYEGPAVVELDAPLERIPVLVRAGTIVPMEELDGSRSLHVYPTAGGEASGQLFDDAGDGFGPHRVERYDLVADGARPRIRRETEGDYEPGAPAPTIVLHGPFETPAGGVQLEG